MSGMKTEVEDGVKDGLDGSEVEMTSAEMSVGRDSSDDSILEPVSLAEVS